MSCSDIIGAIWSNYASSDSLRVVVSVCEKRCLFFDCESFCMREAMLILCLRKFLYERSNAYSLSVKVSV